MSRRLLSWSLLFVVLIAVLVMMWNSKSLNAGIQENDFLYTSGRAASRIHRPHASTWASPSPTCSQRRHIWRATRSS